MCRRCRHVRLHNHGRCRVKRWTSYWTKAFDEGRPFDRFGEWLHQWNLFTPYLPDLLSLVPFLGLVVLLWYVARGKTAAGG